MTTIWLVASDFGEYPIVYDVLTVRQVITDMLVVHTLAAALRRIDAAERSEVLAELRSSLSFNTTMFPGHDDRRIMALVAEETAADILDKIERSLKA